MKQVIYGDVFFLVNFSMDFLALYLTSKLSHAAVSLWRLILGGALGGLYATAALFLPETSEVFLTLVFPFVLAVVVFGRKPLAKTLGKGLLFFAVSFVMGGVMTALYYLIGRLLSSRGIYINGEVETLYSELPLWVIGLCAAWSAWISSIFGRYAKKKASCRSAEVILKEDGREITLSALCDSGHFLEEPIGHLPVIVVTREVMERLLPDALKATFFEKEPDFVATTPRYITKLRFIPITTVGNEALLRGYLPDAVTVGGETKKACVACDEAAHDFEGFDAILPPSLLS